jgi:hypothetical protein
MAADHGRDAVNVAPGARITVGTSHDTPVRFHAGRNSCFLQGRHCMASARAAGRSLAQQDAEEQRGQAREARERTPNSKDDLAPAEAVGGGGHAGNGNHQQFDPEGDLIAGARVADLDGRNVPDAGCDGHGERRPRNLAKPLRDSSREIGVERPKTRHQPGQCQLPADPHRRAKHMKEEP